MDKLLRLFRNLAILILYYIIGVCYYNKVEGWNVLDCCYFITVTIATVGYGHFVPTSDSARVFTVFYSIFGIVFIVTFGVQFVAEYFLRWQDLIVNLIVDTRVNKSIKKNLFSASMVIFLILLGCLFYGCVENWSAATSFYFTNITIMTIGYGDITPVKSSSKIFTIFYLYAVAVAFIVAFKNIYSLIMELRMEDLRKRFSLLRDNSSGNLSSKVFHLSSDFDDSHSNSKLLQSRTVFDDLTKTLRFSLWEIPERELDDWAQSVQSSNQDKFLLESLIKLGIVDPNEHILPLNEMYARLSESENPIREV